MCLLETTLGLIAFMCFGAAACGAGTVTLSIGIACSFALVICVIVGWLLGK